MIMHYSFTLNMETSPTPLLIATYFIYLFIYFFFGGGGEGGYD